MMSPNPADHESDEAVNSDPPAVIDDDGAAGVLVERPDDEDHDLLTFGEAGARLSEELIKQQRVIERLRQGGADEDVVAGAQRRLEALERASQRNRAPSIDELKSSGFFDDPGSRRP